MSNEESLPRILRRVAGQSKIDSYARTTIRIAADEIERFQRLVAKLQNDLVLEKNRRR